MGREIKFRARVENEDGIFEIKRVSKLTLFSGGGLYYAYCENDDYEYQLKPSDLMQYTGLLDKNGKEIYEGDIVNAIDPEHSIAPRYQVVWVECTARFAIQATDIERYGCAEWTMDSKKLEVIGNIYENPELLEGK